MNETSRQPGCRTLVIDTTYGLTVGLVGQEPLHEDGSRSHVEKLERNVEKCLADASCAPSDVTDVVVMTGPGPFTGLRVGIVSAKAFAFATGSRLSGQDVLEPQAWWSAACRPTDSARCVLAVNDARRRQLYYQLFLLEPPAVPADGGPAGQLSNLAAVTPLTGMDIGYPDDIARTVLSALAARGLADCPVSVVGHGAAAYASSWRAFGETARIDDQSVAHAAGAEGLELIARLAARRRSLGKDVSANPLYLRRPDAKLPPSLKPVLSGSTRQEDVGSREATVDPKLRAEAPVSSADTVAEVQKGLLWSSWTRDSQ